MSKGSNFIGLAVLSLIIYAIMLTLTFALKQTEGQAKALGIILIVLGHVSFPTICF
jgi:hypothetical protein